MFCLDTKGMAFKNVIYHLTFVKIRNLCESFVLNQIWNAYQPAKLTSFQKPRKVINVSKRFDIEVVRTDRVSFII